MSTVESTSAIFMLSSTICTISTLRKINSESLICMERRWVSSVLYFITCSFSWVSCCRRLASSVTSRTLVTMRKSLPFSSNMGFPVTRICFSPLMVWLMVTLFKFFHDDKCYGLVKVALIHEILHRAADDILDRDPGDPFVGIIDVKH